MLHPLIQCSDSTMPQLLQRNKQHLFSFTQLTDKEKCVTLFKIKIPVSIMPRHGPILDAVRLTWKENTLTLWLTEQASPEARCRIGAIGGLKALLYDNRFFTTLLLVLHQPQLAVWHFLQLLRASCRTDGLADTFTRCFCLIRMISYKLSINLNFSLLWLSLPGSTV